MPSPTSSTDFSPRRHARSFPPVDQGAVAQHLRARSQARLPLRGDAARLLRLLSERRLPRLPQGRDLPAPSALVVVHRLRLRSAELRPQDVARRPPGHAERASAVATGTEQRHLRLRVQPPHPAAASAAVAQLVFRPQPDPGPAGAAGRCHPQPGVRVRGPAVEGEGRRSVRAGGQAVGRSRRLHRRRRTARPHHADQPGCRDHRLARPGRRLRPTVAGARAGIPVDLVRDAGADRRRGSVDGACLRSSATARRRATSCATAPTGST